ncbi:MAG: helix-turn-helix domain-containing protein [Saprospiraceae bacterium]|nr:helix-turn-helix domain-containing protein [Saprospiraceae bacterium]
MENSFQINFLKEAAKRTLAGKRLADQLVELLDISLASAYNRMNGTSNLSAEELIVVAKAFNISLDQQIHQFEDHISFRFPPLFGRQPQINQFLLLLHRDLSRLSMIQGVNIRYVSNEIPLFYYFHFPALGAFKLFLWGKTIWKDPDVQDTVFSETDWGGLRQEELILLMERLLQQYTAIPSVELWHTHFLDNTLNQIRYYYDQGLIDSKKTAQMLIQCVSNLVNLFDNFLRNGQKSLSSRQTKGFSGLLTVHHNESTHSNNTVLVEAGALTTVYLTFDNPNFMHSDHPKFLAYTRNWIHKLESVSPVVSTHGQAARVRLINLLNMRVYEAMKTLE